VVLAKKRATRGMACNAVETYKLVLFSWQETHVLEVDHEAGSAEDVRCRYSRRLGETAIGQMSYWQLIKGLAGLTRSSIAAWLHLCVWMRRKWWWSRVMRNPVGHGHSDTAFCSHLAGQVLLQATPQPHAKAEQDRGD
jgi:hypothetical protein